MRAELLDTELLHLAVWDGKPGDGIGGTASTVKMWQEWGYQPEIINLQSLKQEVTISENTLNLTAINQLQINDIYPSNHESDSRELMAILFADVVKYSQLIEEQIPQYIKYFLGAVAELEAKDMGHFLLIICVDVGVGCRVYYLLTTAIFTEFQNQETPGTP
ncbi:MAG: hypothetical protein EAZ76_00455 [Nostocales cyanobacterium]|nr:MAG: hypothetical protein EAZ87_21895 [Nostocales cyanobacterium]TAF21440.1 MAG: hypothetical protein EAZ76_00455 [Nostocales cyanobacterium]